MSNPIWLHALPIIDAVNPLLAGGRGNTLTRDNAESVTGVIAGVIGTGARIGVHTLPFTECATCPPVRTTPVSGSVYPMPVATHVPTPDASTPHATSVPEMAKIPRPVAAAQFAPS
jgi:hypothetical protein